MLTKLLVILQINDHLKCNERIICLMLLAIKNLELNLLEICTL